MGTKSIKVTKIDHINMRVNNLADSIEFYRKNFGFEIKEDHSTESEEPWAIIGLPEIAYLCMYEHTDKEITSNFLTINHFGFVIENFGKALDKLHNNGVEVLYGGYVQWPMSRSIYIRDPNGYEIELAEKVGGNLH